MKKPILAPVEESILFYMAIGQAVSQWAHVENGLYNLACAALGDGSDAFGAAYHKIENFRTKLAFTDQAIALSPKFTNLQPDWSATRNNVESQAKIRNKIAHCRTIVFPNSVEGRRYAIVPISYDQSKFKSGKAIPPSGSLCVIDIDQAAKQFAMASNSLFDLLARAEGCPEQFGALAQQVPPRQTLAQLRSLIEAAHLQRAQST